MAKGFADLCTLLEGDCENGLGRGLVVWPIFVTHHHAGAKLRPDQARGLIDNIGSAIHTFHFITALVCLAMKASMRSIVVMPGIRPSRSLWTKLGSFMARLPNAVGVIWDRAQYASISINRFFTVGCIFAIRR